MCERPKPTALDDLSDSSDEDMDFDHLQRFTKKICSMTLEDILKKPEGGQNGNGSARNSDFFDDGEFKNDEIEEFEEVVCEELVDNCLE